MNQSLVDTGRSCKPLFILESTPCSVAVVGRPLATTARLINMQVHALPEVLFDFRRPLLQRFFLCCLADLPLLDVFPVAYVNQAFKKRDPYMESA